jgi:ABC-type phosphate transport system substrate-binding protein
LPLRSRRTNDEARNAIGNPVCITPHIDVFLPHSSAGEGGPIVVIVNESNPVQNLSLSDLRKIFLSDRSRWETGKTIAPVIIAGGAPERYAFLKTVCGMNNADFNKYFVQAAFTGRDITPPREVGSGRDVKSIVAASPGAIGFIRAMEFHGDGSDGGVKAVKVDGLLASEPGYKLRM